MRFVRPGQRAKGAMLHWLSVKVGWAHPGARLLSVLEMVADALDRVERAARS